jgi:hypothetical protein
MVATLPTALPANNMYGFGASRQAAFDKLNIGLIASGDLPFGSIAALAELPESVLFQARIKGELMDLGYDQWIKQPSPEYVICYARAAQPDPGPAVRVGHYRHREDKYRRTGGSAAINPYA